MTQDCKFYVFREGRRKVQGELLLGSLRGSLSRAQDENGWVDALLRAGELECALADAGDPNAGLAAEITDACAKKLASWSYGTDPKLLAKLPVRLQGEFTVSTPEGFAYYALHPRQYVDVVEKIGAGKSAVVVGIRSIGTTLSAMTAAAFRRQGVTAERFTVRPTGHPFEREVEWDDAQQKAIARGRMNRARFVVVDEGPGLSGSSFLSVAEALCAAGVAREQIVLVPSHAPQLTSLRAKDAAERWNKFKSVTAPEGRYPKAQWIGGGVWRERFCGASSAWPGAWAAMERAKFLDERVFWKFEGHGPYGENARKIARVLSEQGFGAEVRRDELGYLGYESVHGRAATHNDLSPERLRRIAEYCALRAQEFRAEVSAAQQKDLATAVRVNYERGFEAQLPAALQKLPVMRGTICDARMSPRKWMLADDGRFLKLGATSHGDDHFFPGPCDIAWDLAGAIIEWEMDAATRENFLHTYTSLTSDPVARRIRNYLVAYGVVRFAWTRTAASSVQSTAEQERFLAESLRYRDAVETWVTAASAAVQAVRAS